jgi:hypothetical protein
MANEMSKDEVIDTLKNRYSGNRNYNLFIPGFIIGAMIAKKTKYFLYEPAFASK